MQKQHTVATFAHTNVPKSGLFCKLVQFSIKNSDYGTVTCLFSEKATFYRKFVQNCENTTAKTYKQGQRWIFLFKRAKFCLESQVI